MNLLKKYILPVVLACLFGFLFACGSSDDSNSSVSSSDDASVEAAMSEPDPTPEPDPTSEPDPTPELEPLPELEPAFIRTNVFLDCYSEENFCGFDLRLGSPPEDDNQVRIVIREVQQITNDEEPLDGCEWATEKKGDVIATFNTLWDVGRGFGITVIPVEGPLAKRTCTFTFGAAGAENYKSLENFSYTFIITQPTDEDLVLTAEYPWGPSEEAVTLQNVLGIEADGWYGSGTREAHLAALEAKGLNTSNVPFPCVGDQIVFVAPLPEPDPESFDYEGADIFTMNIDGSGVVQLTDNDYTNLYPVWSPDGCRIAFTSDASGIREIYVMNADGSNVQQITNITQHSDRMYGAPSWSPDGSKIVFSAKTLNLQGD